MIVQCDAWRYFMTAVYKPIKRFCIPTPLDKQCYAHLPESLCCLLGQTDPSIKTALANSRNSPVISILQRRILLWPDLAFQLTILQGTATKHTKRSMYVCVYVSIKINYKSISLSQLKAESTFLFSPI